LEKIKQKEPDVEALKKKVNEKDIIKDAHAIDFFASVGEQYPIVDEYEIPASYNIDMIVLMPVNAEKLFVYWELTDGLIKKKLKDSSPSEFTVKVFEVNLGAPKKKQEKEIYLFNTKDKVGSNYIDYPAALKPMVAKIGMMSNNTFIEILKAKPVSIPSFGVLGPDDSLWTRSIKDLPKGQVIKKTEKKVEAKKEEFVKELEVVKQILRVRTKDTEILNIFMEIFEKLKDVKDKKAKVMDLLKGFVDVRSKDIELLWLFLDLIEQARYMKTEKSAETIIQYFEEVQKKTDEDIGVSSEIFTNRQVN
jgi:hypothetical protein